MHKEDLEGMAAPSHKVRRRGTRGRAGAGARQLQGGNAAWTRAPAAAACAATHRQAVPPLTCLPQPPSSPHAVPQVGGVRRFVDISVPRNIAPTLNELEGAIVYNVDDLKEVGGGLADLRLALLATAGGGGEVAASGGSAAAGPVADLVPSSAFLPPPPPPPPLCAQVVAANKEERARAAAEAEILLADEQLAFEAWRDSLETVPTIKALRGKVGRRGGCAG